jgi:hypothetical protein
VIGILTEDFALSYDLIRILKRRGLPFKSLDFKDPVPGDVGVVLTSARERGRVSFQKVVEAGRDREARVTSRCSSSASTRGRSA